MKSISDLFNLQKYIFNTHFEMHMIHTEIILPINATFKK